MVKDSKIKFTVAAGCLGLILLIFSGIYAQTTQKAGSLKRVEQKKVKEESEREKQQREEKQELMGALVNEKLRTDDPDKLKEVIKKVGQKKIVDAIPYLIDLLDFRYISFHERTQSHYRSLSEYENYPATEALYYIKKPALPALIKVIETEEEDSLKSKNALTVIQTIFSDEVPKGIEFLEKSTLESATTTGHLRLLKATQKTKEFYRKYLK